MIGLGKNIKTPELDSGIVQSLFVSKNNFSNQSHWIKGLNWIFQNRDWSEYDGFRYDFSSDMNRYGVYYTLSNYELWSWRNSVETNQSAILEIINEYNLSHDSSEQITVENLKKDFPTYSGKLLRYIYYNFDYVFGTKGVTHLSRKLQITTANVWYRSKFSEISFIRNYFSQSKIFIPKNRGNGDDYRHGLDFVIDDLRCQHKSCSLIERQDSYEIFSNNLHKEKHKTLNWLVIEYGVSVYVFDINDIFDPTIITTHKSITIPKERLVFIKDRPNDELTNILKQIFNLSIGSGYIFEMIDSEEPSVEMDLINKNIIIKFNGVDLDSIEKELRDCLEELTNVLY